MVTPEEANRLSAIQQQSANVPGSVLVQATKQKADNKNLWCNKKCSF